MRNVAITAFTVVALTLASCSSVDTEPTAPSTNEKGSGTISATEVTRTSITGLYFNSCVPELVDITGELQTVTQRRELHDGSDELSIKFHLKGDGTGRTTGDKYQLISHTTDEFTYPIDPPYPYVRSFDRVIRMVSAGSNSNAVLLLTIELVVNANGKVVSRITTSSTDCQ